MTPGRLFQSISFALVLVVSLTIPVFPAHAAESAAPIPDFTNFIDSIKDGQAGVVRGAYVQGLFALKVVQQSAKDPVFVSSRPNVATEFKAANEAGNIGLLAHNYLAGQNFPSLKIGQEIRIVFGDGKTEYFKVTKIFHYQALQSKKITSDFLDLDNGERLSSTQLFDKVYRGIRHVTFQTCINKDRDKSWGRMFVIAESFVP